MDKKAFLGVMDNKEAEGVPSLFWFHFSSQATFAASPGNPEHFRKTVSGHEKYAKEVPYGAVKAMTEGYFMPSSLSGLKDYSSASLKSVKRMDPHDPWIEEQVDLCKRISAIAGRESAMFYTLFSPLFYLMFRSVCGTLKNKFLNPVVDRLGRIEAINEKVLKGVRLGKFKKLGESGIIGTDPEAFSIAHDALIQDLKALSKRLLTEGGADGIFLSVQESPGISAEQYKKLIAPGEKELLNLASSISNYNILHVCGQNFNSSLSLYSGYNAKAFNWPAFECGPSLREGKALLGGKAVIGGFAEGKDGVLFKGTREEIESFIEKLVSDTGRKGLIIGADCSVPDNISWDRLKWARDKAAAL